MFSDPPGHLPGVKFAMLQKLYEEKGKFMGIVAKAG